MGVGAVGQKLIGDTKQTVTVRICRLAIDTNVIDISAIRAVVRVVTLEHEAHVWRLASSGRDLRRDEPVVGAIFQGAPPREALVNRLVSRLNLIHRDPAQAGIEHLDAQRIVVSVISVMPHPSAHGDAGLTRSVDRRQAQRVIEARAIEPAQVRGPHVGAAVGLPRPCGRLATDPSLSRGRKAIIIELKVEEGPQGRDVGEVSADRDAHLVRGDGAQVILHLKLEEQNLSAGQSRRHEARGERVRVHQGHRRPAHLDPLGAHDTPIEVARLAAELCRGVR